MPRMSGGFKVNLDGSCKVTEYQDVARTGALGSWDLPSKVASHPGIRGNYVSGAGSRFLNRQAKDSTAK